MIVLAWVLQILLAVLMLIHGLMFTVAFKAFSRMGERSDGPRPEPIPSSFRIFIGIAEIAAAVGLVIPSAIGVLPWLTPLAAVGVGIVMIGAAVLHARRLPGELLPLIGVLVLLVLAVATAYLRWQVVPQ
jgi:uncharacterized membrane protein YphA (DoxX/SURF4 family)